MSKGFLHITTFPVAGDIFVGNEYRGTKDLNIELEEGTYHVSFGDISGYMTPAGFDIKVNPGYTALVSAEYLRAT